MDSVADDGFLCRRVSPFGNLRIDAYVPLPGAYRSLSRPSSAPDAKAFPLCSSSLNLLVLKNYAGSIRFSVCRNCYPFVFPQFASNFCLLLPCLSFALCSVFNVQAPHRGARVSAPIGTKFQHLGSLNAETCFQYGGDSRTRTDDPLLAKQVLSQLSYTPIYEIGGPKWTRTTDLTIISRVL